MATRNSWDPSKLIIKRPSRNLEILGNPTKILGIPGLEERLLPRLGAAAPSGARRRRSQADVRCVFQGSGVVADEALGSLGWLGWALGLGLVGFS